MHFHFLKNSNILAEKMRKIHRWLFVINIVIEITDFVISFLTSNIYPKTGSKLCFSSRWRSGTIWGELWARDQRKQEEQEWFPTPSSSGWFGVVVEAIFRATSALEGHQNHECCPF